MTFRPDGGRFTISPGRPPSITCTSTSEMAMSLKPARPVLTGVVLKTELMISIV